MPTFISMREKMDHFTFLKMAVDEAFIGMRSGDGGPFGAIIARDGKIIGKGHNTVLLSCDPTAHAEVNAIRDACRQVKNPQGRHLFQFRTLSHVPGSHLLGGYTRALLQ